MPQLSEILNGMGTPSVFVGDPFQGVFLPYIVHLPCPPMWAPTALSVPDMTLPL